MAMRKYHRVRFTAAQSAELWERWKKGEGLKSIGRAVGKPSSCIFAHLRPSGGIMPPTRRRCRVALKLVGLRLTFADVAKAIEANNVSRGARYIERNGEGY